MNTPQRTMTISMTELDTLVTQIMNNRQTNEQPQTTLIDELVGTEGDLTDLDKIPDIVRTIREFKGNPTEFSSWKKSVDRVLDIYISISEKNCEVLWDNTRDKK